LGFGIRRSHERRKAPIPNTIEAKIHTRYFMVCYKPYSGTTTDTQHRKNGTKRPFANEIHVFFYDFP
jgi:hypothetical protein